MNSSTFNSRKVTRGFLWALLWIVIFEVFVAAIPTYVMEKVPYEMSMLVGKAGVASGGESYDVLVMGNCFSWAGVKPRTVRSELGKGAFNLSTNLAQTYLLSYLFLQRYLASSRPPPEFIILSLSPWALTYDPEINYDYYNRFLMPIVGAQRDVLGELPLNVRLRAAAHALSPPSVKKQYFLRKHDWPLRILRADRQDYIRIMSLFQYEGGYFNEAWDPGKRPVERVTEIGEEIMAFRLSPLNTTYVEKLLDLCESNNIPVVIFSLAIREDRERIWEEHGVEKKLEDYITSLARRYTCVKEYLNMTDILLEKSYYADDYHLNDEGATLFSRDICERIEKLLPLLQGRKAEE